MYVGHMVISLLIVKLFNTGDKLIKCVLLAEAQHRRLHSAFGWVRPNCLVLLVSSYTKVIK